MFQVIDNYRILWDSLDIFLLAMGIYFLLIIIERTRTVQMLVGIAFLAALYFISQYRELYTLNWILNHFLSSIIIIAVILFQQDIRRALAAVGRNPFFLLPSERKAENSVIVEIVKAASYMASRRIGALIAIERKNPLNDYVEIGTRLDAWVSRELIVTVFNQNSPLHDGGMIIGKNKILSVGSFFPLNTDPELDRELGTRHRAAIGLSMDTDAVIVVVSEEKGTISVAYQGNLIQSLDATSLETQLMQYLNLSKDKAGELVPLRAVLDFFKDKPTDVTKEMGERHDA